MASRAETEASINNDHGLLAKPLHLQRLENAVRLEPFLDYIQNVFSESASSDADNADDFSRSDFELDEDIFKEKFNYRQERRCDRLRLYNFSKVKKNRMWLKDILLSDSSDSDDSSGSITEEDLRDMLKLHKLQKSAQDTFHKNTDLRQYQYYGSGLLSNCDKFYEHQKLVLGSKKLKEKKNEKRKAKLKKKTEGSKSVKEESDVITNNKKAEAKGRKSEDTGDTPVQKQHSKKKNSVSHEAVMNMKRKRLYVSIGKKEIARAQKQMFTTHKETLSTAKKLAQACQREVRKSVLVSQKLVKDVPARARRLTKEMMLYWKRYDKVEKEHRKRAEKEAQEQLRLDIELREAKRQQRKLNFLITQTELYAHFMSRKMSSSLKDAQEEQILMQLDEPKVDSDVPSTSILKSDDEYNSEEMKSLALRNASAAYKSHVDKTTAFDSVMPPTKKENVDILNELEENFNLTNPAFDNEVDHPQPPMLVGKLKTYQLKGMNWLYSLYDKGINGILADEMGLGKTVQTIAFLATLIKAQGIWGPFLVIAPASTLHNWQQEFAKFVPKFKVLPYWGNTNDRKILRKFWSQKDLHTENASFHVLITSYQLVVQDVKYFQRIKWQYMVLDEAQAIKSTSSVRWKILLGFNCRNRLLLTGTPIQNSMAELWALLHFIMPTLFDSHEEFNEWFSKDIESHAENKSMIDEKHLSRLHKILKPFMLRRVKKDVENELSDKIEILVYCPLTQRQKQLYQNLRKKITIDDLMQSSSTLSSSSQSATSHLMNLVMQFRKVCNHPDLFEKREVKSPFAMKSFSYHIPKLLFREGLLFLNNLEKQKLALNTLGIFSAFYLHSSLFPTDSTECYELKDCSFSFMRFIGLSTAEISQMFLSGLLSRCVLAYLMWKSAYRIHHNKIWNHCSNSKFLRREDLVLYPNFPDYSFRLSDSASTPLVFTSNVNNVYGFKNHYITPVKTVYREKANCDLAPLEQQNTDQTSSGCCVRELQMSSPPAFLTNLSSKVIAEAVTVYSSDRSAEWWFSRNKLCGSVQALRTILYGSPDLTAVKVKMQSVMFHPPPLGGINAIRLQNGWSKIIIADKETLVTDSGKLQVLDNLLTRLKADSHRVLIYSQMTRMIDILEDYMCYRKHTYMRLDGSSKIADRRDMVADFQTRSDIFVFLLSTRAGGLGINLTAADTVIFYDSDWNPTVDQQAMDRAHRLGQTKQVTVYRLVCQGSIEERILQRAREKSEIQRMVISGGNFKPDTLKPKEVVSLLLDDDELEKKFRLRQEERKQLEKINLEKKRKPDSFGESKRGRKKKRDEGLHTPTNAFIKSEPIQDGDSLQSMDSIPPSPYSEHSISGNPPAYEDTSSEGTLVVDDSSPSSTPVAFSMQLFGNGNYDENTGSLKKRGSGRGRGRPRGSGRGRGNGRGRGGVLSAAAAELAGAQAGKSAALAAFSYTASNSKPITAEKSPVFRGQRTGARAFSSKYLAAPRGRGTLKVNSSPLPTQSISLGFYMPGPQLQGP
ncbi:chromatin-remodeling ATPase INO80 isoform X1 [Parasteatoda tepidariorum]|uniref:chromatin-remodeling ATPase INO80 isoform X1 n=1 Tax=Parasteatoda tepidariorum TaxID=114398 RepID=UPI00077FAEEF|nr:chromatin-remodeling ATPase INO80 [Parasteatoda tepidariorum]